MRLFWAAKRSTRRRWNPAEVSPRLPGCAACSPMGRPWTSFLPSLLGWSLRVHFTFRVAGTRRSGTFWSRRVEELLSGRWGRRVGLDLGRMTTASHHRSLLDFGMMAVVTTKDWHESQRVWAIWRMKRCPRKSSRMMRTTTDFRFRRPAATGNIANRHGGAGGGLAAAEQRASEVPRPLVPRDIRQHQFAGQSARGVDLVYALAWQAARSGVKPSSSRTSSRCPRTQRFMPRRTRATSAGYEGEDSLPDWWMSVGREDIPKLMVVFKFHQKNDEDKLKR